MSTPALGLNYSTDEMMNQNLRRLDHAIQSVPSASDLAALRAELATLRSEVTALDIRVRALESAAP